ncbi:microsomal signal peptidase 25 kDa subunit-domain-containing protein [Geranomyces variabilis]|nr:microsomal signal peptidase 25 kDa subunit-domain-containing protein [Geranomyces variabilis]KAJ3136044.1 Signal peptidase complex subunit 2 [Geranomyces variabilis]
MAPRKKDATSAATTTQPSTTIASPPTAAAAALNDALNVPSVPVVPSAFCVDLASNPIIVNNSSDSELKHALDDALKKVLVQDFSFIENHTHTDTRLLLGYASVLFAAIASAYSYVVPFPECKPVLAVCVAAYFVLNGAMVGYTTFVEGNVIFRGVRKDVLGLDPDEYITVRTTHEQFSSDVKIEFFFGNDTSKTAAPTSAAGKKAASAAAQAKKGAAVAAAGSRAGVVTLVKSFGAYYDVDGRLSGEALMRDVAGVLRGRKAD